MELIKLGNKVKNKINGFTGIVTGESLTFSGALSFCIRPIELDKDDKPKKAIWIDEAEIVKVDEGISKDLENIEIVESDIALGDEVKHFNGFKGTAVERLEYMNGCLYFHVLSKVGKENAMPSTEFIAAQYLTITETKKPTVKKVSSGGPSSNAPTL